MNIFLSAIESKPIELTAAAAPQVTVLPTDTAEEMPDWLRKMVRRQQSLNKRYEDAHGQFANAYNEFLSTIEEINEQHGTTFSFQQAVTEYQGMFANDGIIEDTEEE